jgi:ubiquinone/menaquinone biosynthesis C-methylase UbiE
MDTKTLAIYDEQASAIVARHLAYGETPTHFGAQLRAYFWGGEATADIGAGSGRDSHWLHQQGFPVVGYDGSEGMLAEARLRYPDCEFHHALLPHLTEIPSATYSNVLCSFVLMHLPYEELPLAIENLARILKPSGRLMVAYRPSKSDSEREADGRLFTPISLEQMQAWMKIATLNVLVAETRQSKADPVTHWHLVVAERLL